ncbi:MAG: hypothetical protein II994_08840, partial [Lachnospiraceae bacterium]|nr:hypothetical protein [Lachnospiraceae bacterium]
LGIDPSTYRMVLGVSDEYGFYRYSYDNPIVDAFADCEEIVKDLNKTSPGTLEEIAEEAAKQTGKSADEVEEFVEEALEDARKKVDAGSGSFTIKDGNSSGNNPLENVVYTDKVKEQMALGDYHSFPEAVDGFGDMGKVSTIVGGDGILRTKVEIAEVIWEKTEYLNIL